MYIHFNLENRIGFWWHEINIVGPSIHLSEFTNTKHQYRLSYCSSSNLYKLMGKFLALFSIKLHALLFLISLHISVHRYLVSMGDGVAWFGFLWVRFLMDRPAAPGVSLIITRLRCLFPLPLLHPFDP